MHHTVISEKSVYKRTVKLGLMQLSNQKHQTGKLDFGEHQATVGTTKAEVIFKRYIDLHVSRYVRTIVEIAFGILIKDIDGRRRHLVMDRKHGEYGFQSASATEQVPGHGFGGIHNELLGMVTKRCLDGIGLVGIT